MELAAQAKLKTLGDYAHEAIKKHLKKTLKWEKTVKKDEDPEALHQMRVGMRRLRTAVSRFELALDLSKSVSDKNIGKIARRLGTLRDLDVLKESLENTYRPNLPQKEQKSLQTAFDALSKQREDALEGVQAIFKDEHYKSLKQGMNEWLENPSYLPVASLPMEELLPDLLLPEVSSLFLDAGWLVGTQVEKTKVVIVKGLKAEKIEKELATNGEMLHTLRKQAKRVRYQMELFTELYAESYSAYVADVKNIQDILGSIQDSVVLGKWLTDVFESEIETKLPTFANLLAENRYKLWQQWQPLQERYLKPETRHGFHLTILHPLTV
jgi:CHAD domain-containing protein